MGWGGAARLSLSGGFFGRPDGLPHATGRPAATAAGVIGLAGLAWLLSNLPLFWAAAAVAAGGGGLLLLRFPHLAWPGLAVALPFASAVKRGPVSLSDVMLGAAVLLWFVEGARKGRLRLNTGLLPSLFVVYLLALLLSVPKAIDLQEAVEGVIKWLQMLVAVLLIQEALTTRQVRWLVWGLLAGGVLQAMLGIYQFVFRIGPPNFILLDRFMRAAGTFGQPNPFAGYLGLTLPVAASLFLMSLSSITRRVSTGLRQVLTGTILYGGAAAVIGAGLLASWSRGGWLGAAAGVSVVLFLQGGPLVKGATLAGAGAVMLLGPLTYRYLPGSLTDRLADLPTYLGSGMWEVVQQQVTDSNFSVIERMAHWIAALRMWETSPWLGVGPGNYAAVYPQVRLERWEDPLGHAHNTYLNVLAENGLIGIIAYLAMWTGVVVWLICVRRRVLQRGRKQVDGQYSSQSLGVAPMPSFPWTAAVLSGVLGVIVHLSVHHVFDNLYVQGIYLHVALWLGAAVALMRSEAAEGAAA
ncbi:MAG: O-antigen ligase family protein [Caldilineaceae bacterium]|nr:O-antigen ligase family protein [Caldilineaceae bacterium]